MADLKTIYGGITLENPFIVSSSPLTANLQNLEKADRAGAGAVVLKSLFEEQIPAVEKGNTAIDYAGYPEAEEYLERMTKLLHPESCLELIEQAKQSLDIPVIASLNCLSDDWWIEYAAQIETAGADGLELNVSYLAVDPKEGPQEVEDRVISMIRAVKKQVSIPLSVKLGDRYSSLPHLVSRIDKLEIAGLVLFNRFFKPDIDINALRFSQGSGLSQPGEALETLRWVGILSSLFPEMSLSVSTGVHRWEDAAKLLLAGASSIQVYSTLVQNGWEHLEEMKKGLSDWMDGKDFADLLSLIGTMGRETDLTSSGFYRLQYIKQIVNPRKGE